VSIVWEQWWPKDIPSRQARFTGFGSGNGYALLSWLHDREIEAVRDGEDVLLDTRKREDARLSPGDWLVDGAENDVYPREDAVNAARFEQRPGTGR
jgi:hypothetical protein